MIWSPFGSSNKVDKYFQDLFNTLLGDYVYPTTGQGQISVLLLNDETVENYLDGRWPAPYSFYGSVLEDLLEHQPKAVFIDFYWMDRQKPDKEYLILVLKMYQEKGIPIYLAMQDQQDLELNWPELKQLIIPVSPAVQVDGDDFISRSYPLTNNGLKSPAAAMYGDLYDSEALLNCPIDIVWGTAANQQNNAWMVGSVSEIDLVGIVTEGLNSIDRKTPYTTTVFVRDLVNPTGASFEEAIKDLDNHLKDRVVFFGGNLSGIQDLVFTPTREILPGVYYHAMGLDNLLSYGSNYKSDEKSFELQTGLPIHALHLIILLPLCIFIVLSNGDLVRISKHKTINHILSVSFIGVWIVAWILLCFNWLNLSVSVWVGYIQLIGLGFFLDKLDLLDRLHHTSKSGFHYIRQWVA
ncbi:CHASE2 domain-containing protein [Amphritea sp. 1_MG-2023]|nr:CHASE2 domain-containing protein [Amphritea sp. 1_MG-2023]MDO6563560.1 CHASE2 domain-containing protein [Amphritea sp. 1_MG-2023]